MVQVGRCRPLLAASLLGIFAGEAIASKVVTKTEVVSSKTPPSSTEQQQQRRRSPKKLGSDWTKNGFSKPKKVIQDSGKPQEEHVFIIYSIVNSTGSKAERILDELEALEKQGRTRRSKKTVQAMQSSEAPRTLELLLDPHAIERRSWLSTSVINNLTSTFSPAGLILRVPKKNIVATIPRDAHTLVDGKNAEQNGELESFLEWLWARYGIAPSPNDLLSKTTPGTHNEVVIRGSSGESKSKVKVTGLFVKIDKFGPLVSERFRKRLDKISKDKRLPLMELHETADEVANKRLHVHRQNGHKSIEWQHDGVRHVLNLGTGSFFFFSSGGKHKLKAAAEAEQKKKFIQKIKHSRNRQIMAAVKELRKRNPALLEEEQPEGMSP